MATDDTLGSGFPYVLAAARNGDGQAFERLYRLLATRVHAYLRVRGSRDPEGMVNEVFLKAFTGIDRFRGSEPQFKAWVFRIAHNQLVDEARSRERRIVEVVLDEATTLESVAGGDDVEAQAIATVALAERVAALDVLTAEQRDVILLRTVADLTVEDVATILGKQPGAVKALQRRALRTLARVAADRSPTPLRTPSGSGG